MDHSSEHSPCLDKHSHRKTNQPVQPAVRSISFEALNRPSSLPTQHLIHQLSDIGEVSSSSQNTVGEKKACRPTNISPSKNGALARDLPANLTKAPSNSTATGLQIPPDVHSSAEPHARLGSRTTSAVSLPLNEIPERRSSMSVFQSAIPASRHASLQDLPSWKVPDGLSRAPFVPDRGRAESPVRLSLDRGIQSSEILRSSLSRTFVRCNGSTEILERGFERHARVSMSLRLPSPLFVGGGTVEGQIELHTDKDITRKSTRPLLVSRLCVDVVGVEEAGDGKRHVFLSLATELFDAKHPPPPGMLASLTPLKGSELLWETKPASVIVPFCIHLPLKLGPPPYLSKGASIRYLLCPTANFRIGGKHVTVRQTWNIQMLTIHDPEKALGSLPSPLIASDTLTVATSPEQNVKLTAGLHRQTWVNGNYLFADIHVINNTTKLIKRIELFVEKTTLFYNHTAAGTADKSASYLRLPKRHETDVISTNAIKKSKAWPGIRAQSSEVRTVEIELPRGHVTISSGRFFEVRYYVRIVVGLNMFKSLAVQLPITIIHMNSLDILPNALAQVAASVEAKRSKVLPISHADADELPYSQGGSFLAPRRQSLERARATEGSHSHDIDRLTLEVDSSPRHARGSLGLQCLQQQDAITVAPLTTNRRNRSSMASHSHLERHPSCYHCQLINIARARPGSSGYQGPKLPRLQVSTSGLGFSESEFELAADSPPRKVMLSEHERQMIYQQRELKAQRQWASKAYPSRGNDVKNSRRASYSGYVGYTNVAAAPSTTRPNQTTHLERNLLFGRENVRRTNHMIPSNLNARAKLGRPRRATSPDIFFDGVDMEVLHNIKPGVRSMDRGSRPFKAVVLDDDTAVRRRSINPS